MDPQFSLAANLESFRLAYYLLMTLVHVAFAAGVARDAGNVMRYRGGTILVGPYVWAFATLVGGVLVGVAYWVIHHMLATAPRNFQASYTEPE